MTITGDGYFRVGLGDGDYEVYFTRSGNFYRSDEGDLVTADGLFVDEQPVSSDEITFIRAVEVPGSCKVHFIISVSQSDTEIAVSCNSHV